MIVTKIVSALPFYLSKKASDEIVESIGELGLSRLPVLSALPSIIKKMERETGGRHKHFEVAYRKLGRKKVVTQLIHYPDRSKPLSFYPPGLIYAAIVLDCFAAGHQLVLLWALLQSGKSSLVAAMGLILQYGGHLLPAELTHTPLSFLNTLPDLELNKQDADKLGRCHVRVFKKFDIRRDEEIKNIRGLAALDEIHWGTIEGGLVEKNVTALSHNAQLLFISATPYNLSHSESFMSRAKVVRFSRSLLKDYGYWGLGEFYEAGLVYDNLGESPMFLRTVGTKKVFEISPRFEGALNDFLAQRKQLLFIVRCGTGKHFKAAQSRLKSYPGLKVETHTQEASLDLKKLEDSKQHTVILLKNKMRVGIALDPKLKENIWGVWEKNDVVATVAQGVPGRMAGYGNNRHIRLYCDKASLAHYLKLSGYPVVLDGTRKLHSRVIKDKTKASSALLNITSKFPVRSVSEMLTMSKTEQKGYLKKRINALRIRNPLAPGVFKVDEVLCTTTSRNQRAAEAVELNRPMTGAHTRRENCIVIVSTGKDPKGRRLKTSARVMLQILGKAEKSELVTSQDDTFSSERLPLVLAASDTSYRYSHYN